MSTGAILMMILAIAVLWGGLALAVLNISRAGRRSRRAGPGGEPEAGAEPSLDR